MLNHTNKLQRQGIVRFTQNAAEYVPQEPGIYRFITVPFSVSAASKNDALPRYFRLFDATKLDTRNGVSAEYTPDHLPATIEVQTTLSNRTSNTDTSRSIADIASLFPPLYIGQAVDLRSRFNDHATGTNDSQILKNLRQHNLTKHMTFFHWHRCPIAQLQEFESILIQAHFPVFNRRLNQNW